MSPSSTQHHFTVSECSTEPGAPFLGRLNPCAVNVLVTTASGIQRSQFALFVLRSGLARQIVFCALWLATALWTWTHLS
jgi:hypothetical protein